MAEVTIKPDGESAVQGDLGCGWKLGRLEVTWWGWGETHKWRWHGTHIDLGPLSVYELAQWDDDADTIRDRHWSWPGWRVLAVLIKPLRWWYHLRHCRPRSLGGGV